MKKIVLLLTCLIATNFFAQEKVYYNFAVNNCTEESADNMIENCIKGSYLLDYDFTSIDGKTLSTSKVKKPMVIIAGASWSAPCHGDIPAINKMVEKYGDKLQFVMILWDNEAKAKRMVDKLNKNVFIIPAREGDKVKKDYLDISGFVHKLDYPTAYLIDKTKKFVNVKRGAATPTKQVGWDQVNEINIKNFEEFLAPILN
ncbi:Thioredoxin domain-containing protein [Tenacibaculum sp. 190130A14a]|uniref:Thioredoxin domain-containing protein n=1 Tax=Tenacibaculum polynesiense TaxID=3137857 RepID=A0ABP1EYA8_9FLAO